ncbi:antiviral helicase SKI2 [Pancytospora epiphaga]|nr:antiviral helicase SKI2 [Pancytospora epiphaga]
MKSPDSLDMHTLRNALPERQYSLSVGKDWIPEDYSEKVDESILNIKYKPDIFQKQSFYLLSINQPVFVSAHTSSGKTLVAEYAICRAQKNGTRVIYTSPIKALSNQKFYDFKQKYENIGLITGDVQVNPDAQCIIMTTEILRNLVYRNSDLLRDTEYVVFDEVHYINDAARGVVWEESIIMMPKHISLILLSATIPNALEFGEWVGRTRSQCVYVISTDKRPVPLEFAVYCDSNAFSFGEGKGHEKLQAREDKSGQVTNFPEMLTPYSSKIKPRVYFRISDLGNYITNRRLIPAIFFSFSRKACEKYGETLQLLDLTSSLEKKKIGAFLQQALSSLNEEDRFLPQVLNMQKYVARGVAVHHSGLLPFVKECIELLFSKNLIKILVATETFAMGVNMPAKCCVFLSLTKIDGGSYRYLTPGEFTQMSGRAGRRGMDKVGTVILADHRIPPVQVIKKMLYGVPHSLSSQFKLSFSLILMALRTNVEVEELMRSSFKEHGAQKSLAHDMVQLEKLESVEGYACDKCSGMDSFLKNMSLICKENFYLINKVLQPGSILLLKNNSLVKVVEINGTRMKVEPCDGAEMCDKLYIKVSEATSSTSGIPTLQKGNFLSIGESSESTLTDALLDDIFAVIVDGFVFLDYPLTDIHLVENIMAIKAAYSELISDSCLECPFFVKHYYMAIEMLEVKNEIEAIKKKYDRNSLKLMTEYSARTKFLRNNGYITGEMDLKGRIAAEIRTVNEILVTELITNNVLNELSPSELVTVFSLMIHDARDDGEQDVPEMFVEIVAVIREHYESLAEEIEELGIPRMEPLSIGMIGAVYDWCQGLSFGRIVSKHNVQEGIFVRLILRLEECCREMLNVAALIGDTVLEEKFTEAEKLIKRDIVFMPSLYI